MSELIVEQCTEQVSNLYKLVLLASQRAYDLSMGESSALEATKLKLHKNTVISLYEIAEKKVSVNELFNSLVNRRKDYIKSNTDSIFNDAEKKLLSFSNGQSDLIQEEIENDVTCLQGGEDDSLADLDDEELCDD